jgi:uncharacterized protein DUF2793
MTTTPNLALPYLAAAQAQKHVTVNEALDHLDGLVQLSVISSSLTVPPAGPADGDRYIVAASATGDWAGWDDSVAHFSGGAWLRLIPQTGWIAWDQAMGGIITFDVTNGWAGLASGPVAFTGLTDTPAAFTGQAGKALQVNTAETALEFVLPATGGGGGGVSGGGLTKIPVVNGDFETGDITGWTLTNGVAAVADWSTIAGYDTAGATVARNGTYVFSGGEGGLAQARVTAFQDIDISGDASAIYWVTAELLKNYQDSDKPSITFELIDAVGTILASTSAIKTDGFVSITPVILSLARPGGAVTARLTLDVTRGTGNNNNAAIDNVELLGSGSGAAVTPTADAIVAQSNNGATIGMHIAEELLTGLSGVSVSSGITIPDRAIVLGVSTRTVTEITGATAFDCGIAGQTAKFGGALGVASGSTNVGVIGPEAFYAATPIVLTANGGNFTGGDVRIAIQFLLPTAPTS